MECKCVKCGGDAKVCIKPQPRQVQSAALGYVWCAGWYATKLHAVPVAKHCATETKYADMESVCGAYVYKEARTPWAERKIEKGIAKCKHCERMLNT